MLANNLKSSQCGFDPHSGHNFVININHPHSSKALAPSASAIGLSDQRRPQVVRFAAAYV
jgi:hypothetical protein